MKFQLPTSEIFVPDGLPNGKALERTTHLGIAAHQDDLEILGASAIVECFQQKHNWFTGVVVTDGRGSPRDGLYGAYSDEEMRLVRLKEQKKAAVVGEYGAQVLLDYPSAAVKSFQDSRAVNDLEAILLATRPREVFTHNLADKHDTHVGVALKVIEALRRLPPALRPDRVLGCEVWRDLDWLLDGEKVVLDCSRQENLQMALLGVFDSQISGGKRYDLAAMGRRRAHATFAASHGTDGTSGLVFAMDLTPLMLDKALSPAGVIAKSIERFRDDVMGRLERMGGPRS